MSLAIYKFMAPMRGGVHIEYVVIDRNMPTSNAMIILLPWRRSKLAKFIPIFSSCGLAKDYESQRTPSSFLDILVVTGLSKSCIYQEYNKIQESDLSYIHSEPTE